MNTLIKRLINDGTLSEAAEACVWQKTKRDCWTGHPVNCALWHRLSDE